MDFSESQSIVAHPKLYLPMFTHLTSGRESVMVPMLENTPYGSFVRIVEGGIQTSELSVDGPALALAFYYGLFSEAH